MKNRSKRTILWVIIFTGISSVVTQLLTIREFLSQFNGNEIVIAQILFNWLVLGGLGTWLAKFIGRNPNYCSETILGGASMFLAALPPLQIMAIRLFRDMLFIHGSSVGFYPTLIYTFIMLAPYCILVGFVLPYSLFVLRIRIPGYPGTRIYIMDNLGDVLGGILFSFVLVFLFTPMQAVLLANLPLSIWGFFLSHVKNKPGMIPLLSLLFCFMFLLTGVLLENRFLIPGKGQLIHYEESLYGRITVHRDREQYTLFENNIPMYHTQNRVTAEEGVHYPLAQINSYHDLLLISAEGGVVKELEKYHPDTIDYVELNPDLTRVLFEYNLVEKILPLNVINQDGRAYLSSTQKKYDAIILNLPEPDTFQLNRFYTREFFNLAKSRLRPDGIFSFSMKGYDNYLSNIQQQKISSLFLTVSEYFEHILLLPGQKIYFLCRNQPVDPDIPSILSQKGIQADYIRGYFYGNLTHERIALLNKLVHQESEKNTDLSPNLIRVLFSQWFEKYATSPTYFLGTLGVLCLIYFYYMNREEFVIFSTGFYTMGSEILVIFSFQIFFGYIYFQIGMIITVFLAGLLPGAFFGSRLIRFGKQCLMGAEVCLIIFMVIFTLIITMTGSRVPSAVFLLYGLCVSLICGFQFPLALALRNDSNPAVTRFFSADLVGAAIGTISTSMLLIPYLGITGTAGTFIGLKILSLMVIGSGGLRRAHRAKRMA